MKTDFSADTIFSYLFPWHRTRVVEQLAGAVARQCRVGVWNRVGHKTSLMTISEVRGYVRARAAGCLAEEVDQALAHYRLDLGLRSRVLASAMDQLIAMVLHDVLSEQPSGEMSTMAA